MIKMEEEPVSTIREISRNALKLSRRFHRDEETDFRRSVASSSIKSENIEKIADKLKTRSSISVAELLTLKNGLMEDSKYIEEVLNVNGALRGLVRELIGAEVRKQSAAAGCFCNLALGDSKAASAIAKSAGPYLVAAVDNLNTELAVTCIWTLGNLAGSGPKASVLLVAQGALTKLCDILSSTNEEIVEAGLYALVHFAYQLKDELSTDHLTRITQDLNKLNLNSTSLQLLFILSCHKNFKPLPEIYIQKILQESHVSIKHHISCCKTSCIKDCKLLYLFRILANTVLSESVANLCIDSFKYLVEDLKVIIVKEDSLAKALLWLLGNMFKLNRENVFFTELLNRGF